MGNTISDLVGYEIVSIDEKSQRSYVLSRDISFKRPYWVPFQNPIITIPKGTHFYVTRIFYYAGEYHIMGRFDQYTEEANVSSLFSSINPLIPSMGVVEKSDLK